MCFGERMDWGASVMLTLLKCAHAMSDNMCLYSILLCLHCPYVIVCIPCLSTLVCEQLWVYCKCLYSAFGKVFRTLDLQPYSKIDQIINVHTIPHNDKAKTGF